MSNTELKPSLSDVKVGDKLRLTHIVKGSSFKLGDIVTVERVSTSHVYYWAVNADGLSGIFYYHEVEPA